MFVWNFDVMNLFAICHLDVNVVTNELIYLVLLKVYYVKVLKDDLFCNVITYYVKFFKKMLYTCIFFKETYLLLLVS